MLTEGRFDNLPDVKQMLPFVFLSSVVVFKLIKEDHHSILTCSQPNLSILGADGFDLAPLLETQMLLASLMLSRSRLPLSLLLLDKSLFLPPTLSSLTDVFGAFQLLSL